MKTWINPRHVIAASEDEGRVIVRLVDGSRWYVKEEGFTIVSLFETRDLVEVRQYP